LTTKLRHTFEELPHVVVI